MMLNIHPSLSALMDFSHSGNCSHFGYYLPRLTMWFSDSSVSFFKNLLINVLPLKNDGFSLRYSMRVFSKIPRIKNKNTPKKNIATKKKEQCDEKRSSWGNSF